MAAITAAMVKELREMTGAGMMDCKKALAETDGNMDAAVDVLKKSGAAKMEKKASRIAAEGITRVAVSGNKAVVVEVNSETDFVAKNEVFQEFVQEVADKALASGLNGGKDGEDVKTMMEDGLEEVIADKTLKFVDPVLVHCCRQSLDDLLSGKRIYQIGRADLNGRCACHHHFYYIFCC